MSETIDLIRAQYPAYANVPDDELTLAIGDKYPTYLAQDREFQREHNRLSYLRARESDKVQAQDDARSVWGVAKRVLTKGEGTADANELAGAAGEDGRLTQPGEAMAATGKLLAAGLADTGLRIGGQRTDENMRAAERDPVTAPLPIEQQLDALGTVGSAVTKGLLSVPKMAPAMALGTVTAPVVSPYVSFPAAFATQTYGETGDAAAAGQSAATAALFPLVGRMLQPVGASLGANLVRHGLIKAENTTAQKAVEAAVGQVGFQTAAQLAALPEYLDLSPHERMLKFAETTAANLVFAIPDAVGVLGKSPSHTQAKLAQDIAEATRKFYAEQGQPINEPGGAANRSSTAQPAESEPMKAEAESRPAPARPSLPEVPGVPTPLEGQPYELSKVELPPAQLKAEAETLNSPAKVVESPELRVESPTAEAKPPETNTQLVDEPVRQVPAGEIATRPDLMQFKRMDEAASGVNEADKLAGQWDDRKAGVLLLWEPLDAKAHGLADGQRYIVANGHHRFEFGERAGRKGYNAQVLREADGFSASDARRIAAEVNIADGKGTVYDQAKYFRNTAAALGPDAALAAGRRIGARGRQAADIGIHATDDLFTSFVNEQITPEAARAIATAAPGDAGAQRIGIKFALQGKGADFISNVIKASQAEAGQRAESLDLFGADDSAMKAMAEQAQRASELQKELRDRITVLRAGKKVEIAKSEGIDVQNPEAIPQRIAALQGELARWENWPMQPDLVAKVKGEKASGSSALSAALMTPEEFAAASSVAAEEAFAARKTGASAGGRTDGDDVGGLMQQARRLRHTKAGKRKAEFIADGRADAEVAHLIGLEKAVAAQQPVSASAVDSYGLKLPAGYVRVGERYVFQPPARFSLAPAETVEQQKVRLAQEQAAREAKAQQDKLAELQAKPLQGTAGDLGQGDLLAQPDDLFAPPTPKAGRVAASGTSAPRPSRAAIAKGVPPEVAATPAPKLGPLRQWWQDTSTSFKSVVAPAAIDSGARDVANIMRERLGERALALDRAEATMHTLRNEFDRTPVPRNWQYLEGEALPHNYAVIDAFERDRSSLPERYQELAKYFDAAFAERIAAIQKYAPRALNHLIEHYFPHIWEDPHRAQGVMAQMSNRLFAGRKEFLKQRTLPVFADGLARGLKPISDNPVDLLLAKMHSMDKFLAALKAQAEFKDIGALKFKYALESMPDGWVKFEDPAFVVNAPPEVTIKEAFDAQLRTRTLELLQKLGVPQSRLATLGGRRWGLAYESPEQIKTRFGGPMSVYWHELGHILDFRYNLQRGFLKQGKEFDNQLRALADARWEGSDTSKSFKRYVRKGEEKMAVMLEAYTHAPEVFREKAPDVLRQFENFISAHPELHDIRELRPSLRLGVGETTKELPGVLKLGDWIMPAGPAQVIQNYLSPGLARLGAYRSLRTMSNVLNGAQLGLSAFHLGFTSLDAATSAAALGIKQLAEGHPLDSLKTFAEVPVSPVTNMVTGAKLRAEALKPGTHPEMASMVKALEQAGGRVGNDRMWQTEFTRRMVRAWHEGGLQWATLPVRAPLAAWEQMMRPILEYVVPRQKLGVFARMASYELAKLGPNADAATTREALRKVWDSVDNRMGQVVYDNLFYNRAVKDVALMAFRAYGWQLGKYREGLGAVADTAAGLNRLRKLERPELTHRMAYAMALPLMVGTIGGVVHALMTGKNPETAQDYFQPQTGELDRNGNPVRLNLPSYVKDVIAYAKHPLTSFGHSLNPFMSSLFDVLQNRDFYNTEIRHPDDPLWRQGADVAKFAAKQFMPFSVSGAQKLQEDAAPAWKQIAPFFGITPVPARITMTPAQELASEITAAMMPAGARTKEQFDRSEALKDIVAGLRSGDRERGTLAQQKLRDVAAQRPFDAQAATVMLEKVKMSPLQFQVHHMSLEDGMRVWRLASPAERPTIFPILKVKVENAKTFSPARQVEFARELMANK